MKRIATEIGLFMGSLVIHDLVVGSIIVITLMALVLYGVMVRTNYND